MSERRARKKLETREKILAATKKLIDSHGFQAATMEEVAASADVGVGTLYNYFGSKERLLLALFQRDTAEILAAGEPIVQDPGADPVAALVSISTIYLRWIELYDREVLREILAASFLQPQEVMTEFMGLDFQLMGQLAQLIATLQARGDVATDVEVESAAQLLYGAAVVPLMTFVGSPDLDVAWLHRTVKTQIELAFDGLRSR